jgi:hypothetical protein
MVTAREARATWPTEAEWAEVDRELRGNAKKRSGLDAHEMYWLRQAERVRIWVPLGMVSMLDYMDRVLGHTPETARKRLRVARALADLPLMSAALERGDLTFSAVRELTRVATSATERAWIGATRARSSREIEDLVNGRRPGDLPSDAADPEVTTHVVRFELTAPAYALLREARLVLDDEHGGRLDDSQLFEALCGAVRGDGAATDGRAKFQIAYTVCECCEQGWQTGGGAQVAVDAAAVERAHCDAQYIGSIAGAAVERARQPIPPSVVRFVWARDKGRCQTPGCRSARCLEIHHIIPVSAGGSNDPSNLTLRCSACHTAHHDGRLTISGTAPDHITTTRNGASITAKPHHRAPGTDPTDPYREQAIDALTGLGWKRGVAASSVDEALGHVAHDADIATVIHEALRRCPRPATAG